MAFAISKYAESPWIKNLQNILSGVVSSFMYVSLPYTFVNPSFSIVNTVVICAHCLIDFPFAKNEVILHHLCVFGFCSFMYQGNISPESFSSLSNTLYSTELSSIFYVFHLVSDHNHFIKKILPLNDALFVGSFFYFRIYCYGRYIIANKMLYNIMGMYDHYPIWYSLNCLVPVYILYGINLYWFTQIISTGYNISHFQNHTE